MERMDFFRYLPVSTQRELCALLKYRPYAEGTRVA